MSLYSSFQSNIENVGNVVITEMFLCCYTTEGSLSIYLFKTFNFSSVTNLDIYPPNVRVPGGLLVDQREGETSSTMMVLSGKNYPIIKNVSHFPSPFGHNGQGQQILRANKSPQ